MIKKSDGQWRLYSMDGKKKLHEGNLSSVMREDYRIKQAVKVKKIPKGEMNTHDHDSHNSHGRSHKSSGY